MKLNKLFQYGLMAIFLLENAVAIEKETDSGDKINASISINIGDITPVKDGMSREEAEMVIQNFLQTEVFKRENELHMKDIVKQESVQTNGTGRIFQLITFADGTQWVPCSNDGLQRFLGALYLKKAIEHHNINDFCAVETRFILKDQRENITIVIKNPQDAPLKNIFTLNSNNFISVSRYVGDKKPDIFYSCDKLNLKKLTGFSDFTANANLRIQDGNHKVTVIDTEYGSFSNDNTVDTPSQETELQLGGATFTFSKS